MSSKTKKTPTLADEIAELITAAPKTYDPDEDLAFNDSAKITQDFEFKPQAVGRGQLRVKAIAPELDGKFKGKVVTKKELEMQSKLPSTIDDSELQLDDDDEDDFPRSARKGKKPVKKAEESEDEEDEDQEEISMDEDEAEEDPDEGSGIDSDLAAEAIFEGSDDEDEEGKQSEEEEESEDELVTRAAEEADRMEAELKEQESEVKLISEEAKKAAEEEMEKALHVRNQVKIWDCCMDTRIRMQQGIVLANRLPNPEVLPQFIAGSSEISGLMEEVAKEAEGLLEDLNEVASELWDSNPEIVGQCGGKFNRKEKPWERSHRFEPYLHDVLDRWHDRTQAANAAGQTRKFKAIDLSPYAQTQRTLSADMSKLLSRSRMKRSPGRILGRSLLAETKDTVVPATDEEMVESDEVYDDTDFYSELLRELVENAATGGDDAAGGAVDLLGEARQRAKQAKRAGTLKRQSKGRGMRFDTHPKLVGFMAPYEPPSLAEWDTTHLFTNIFGGAQQ